MEKRESPMVDVAVKIRAHLANTLHGHTKIIVETEEVNPKQVAIITAEEIKVAEGFVVRMTPI